MKWDFKYKYLFLLLHFLILFPSASLHSQSAGKSTSQNELIAYIKKLYRLDDLIYQGRFYQEEEPMAKGNPFFLRDHKTEVDLYIAQRFFPDVTVFYNIVKDELIMEIPHDRYMKVLIGLPVHLVDSFVIDKHLFISSQYLPGARPENYFEKIYSGKRLYMMHYEKRFVANYTPVNPNGFYSSVSTILYIVDGENWIPCIHRRTFLKYFNTNKKLLRRFMHRQQIRFKKASSQQLKVLCEFADKQLEE